MKRVCFLFIFLFPSLSACGSSVKNSPRVKIKDIIFQVEVMKTPEQWSKGMMFRQELNPKEGMLFLGKEDKVQTFWMKNTLLSLDIIFISKDLKIVHIVREATPLSEKPLSSQKTARHVLEILGGQAEKLSLQVEDIVYFQNIE